MGKSSCHLISKGFAIGHHLSGFAGHNPSKSWYINLLQIATKLLQNVSGVPFIKKMTKKLLKNASTITKRIIYEKVGLKLITSCDDYDKYWNEKYCWSFSGFSGRNATMVFLMFFNL